MILIFSVENFAWEMNWDGIPGSDIGDITDINFGPGNPVYDNVVYTGFYPGGLSASGDVFESEVSSFHVILSGAALDNGLNENIVNYGDVATGVARFKINGAETDFNFSVTAVPEPSTSAMFGLAGIAAIIRRRR